MHWILFTLCIFAALSLSSGIRYMNICKWSNEGCKSDNECCSQRCRQEHPGTNFRCTRTDMGGLCLYRFHCGHRMLCGQRNRCCARHWGTCSRDNDCCKRYHTCQKINGFIYRKCLPRNTFLNCAHAQRYSLLVSGTVCLTIITVLIPQLL